MLLRRSIEMPFWLGGGPSRIITVGDRLSNPMWMKAHQWIVTPGAPGPGAGGCRGPDYHSSGGAVEHPPRPPGRRPPIVDEQPLKTARAMAALATDWDEQRFSRQALKLADHAVDIAFSYEMRPGHGASGPANAREQETLCPGQSGRSGGKSRSGPGSTNSRSNSPARKTITGETPCSSRSI